MIVLFKGDFVEADIYLGDLYVTIAKDTVEYPHIALPSADCASYIRNSVHESLLQNCTYIPLDNIIAEAIKQYEDEQCTLQNLQKNEFYIDAVSAAEWNKWAFDICRALGIPWRHAYKTACYHGVTVIGYRPENREFVHSNLFIEALAPFHFANLNEFLKAIGLTKEESEDEV